MYFKKAKIIQCSSGSLVCDIIIIMVKIIIDLQPLLILVNISISKPELQGNVKTAFRLISLCATCDVLHGGLQTGILSTETTHESTCYTNRHNWNKTEIMRPSLAKQAV